MNEVDLSLDIDEVDSFNHSRKYDRILRDEDGDIESARLDQVCQDKDSKNCRTIIDFLKSSSSIAPTKNKPVVPSFSKTIGDNQNQNNKISSEVTKKGSADIFEGLGSDRKFLWLTCSKCGERQLSRVSHVNMIKFVCCDFCEGDFIDVMDLYMDPNRVFS